LKKSNIIKKNQLVLYPKAFKNKKSFTMCEGFIPWWAMRDCRSPIETATANTILMSYAHIVFFVFKKSRSKLLIFLKTKNPDEKFIRIVIDVGNEGFEPPTLSV
jgi:hypothetical protein